jgi:hypothetical protein
MTVLARQAPFADPKSITPTSLDLEFRNIIDQWNRHDQANSKWQKISTSGTLNVDGTTTFNTATYTWPAALPGTTSILQTTSGGALSWVTSSTAYAPVGAAYVIVGTNATLTAARTITAGTAISLIDGGAGTTETINNTGVTSAIGTPNQINVSGATGAVTFSTPQNINTGAGPTFASLTLSGLTANSFLYSGASGLLTTTLAPTNGQLLIGSTGVAPALAALTGTTNQVSVTNAAGSITLATPQNIDIGATVTFASLTLTGQFLGKTGALASPSWGFSAETGLGAYRNGPGEIDFVVGSNPMLAMNSTQVSFYSGGTRKIDFLTGSAVPVTDNAISLGTSSQRWSDFRSVLGTVSTTFNVVSQTGYQAGGNQVFPIVQVISSTVNTTTTVTNTAYADTVTTATITPKFNTSKIYISLNGYLAAVSGVGIAFATLARGGTNLLSANGFAQTFGSPTATYASFNYYDSPASTSPTTYTVQVKNTTSGDSALWGTANAMTITLMEIAQ